MFDYMPGINDALARNAALPKPQSGGFFRQGGTFSNVLGAIGDALLTANGHDPVYRPAQQQRRMGAALSNYLGNTDQALADIMAQDLGAGVALYKMKHPEAQNEPEVVRELRAAGIDPASEQGREILIRRLNGKGQADPNFVRELEALGIDPHSAEAKELYYGRNSPAGYLLKPPSLGGDSTPTVNSQEEYDALPPGTRYRDSQGNSGVKGGATASTPSPTFR